MTRPFQDPEDKYAFDHITPESLVIDTGCFRGEWSAEMAKRYDCRVLALEPIKAFHADCAARLAGNPKIELHNVGLSAWPGEKTLYVSGDSTGQWANPDWPTERVTMWSLRDLMSYRKIKEVAAWKINAEGAEFDLLESALINKFMPRFAAIIVQFHGCVPNAGDRYDELRRRMLETHELESDGGMVWSRWKRK